MLLGLALAVTPILPLRADEVRLRLQISDWTHEQVSADTNEYQALDVIGLTESSHYRWERGVGYTNFWFQNWLATTGYGNEPTPRGVATGIYRYTNITTAPWMDGGLGIGTFLNSGLIREHSWVNGVWVEDSYVNQWADPPDTNYNVTVTLTGTDGLWPMGSWSYSLTNGVAHDAQTYGISSQAELVTSGEAGQSALFCLSGMVRDWSLGFELPLVGGWTLLTQTPDTQGRVFAVLGNQSTNDVSIALEMTTAASVSNWTYTVGVQRVDLGMQWKGPNDTNWSSGPLYVLKDTTVQFRVTTPGFTGVAWPPGTPAWSNGESNTTQISMTFNTVSSDTNGQWVTVTAGSMASNRVVVFDYEVKFFGANTEFSTNSRTGFGVGETVNFVALVTPAGVTVDNVGGIGWTVSGMYYDSSYLDDLSIPNATGIELGAFEETDQVTGTLSGGVSAGGSRTNHFDVWRPKAAILKDMIFTNAPAGGRLIEWPHVGHVTNSIFCFKRAAYFLHPQTNDYSGIRARESTGTYNFSNGSNSIVGNTNTTQITFSLTNGAGTVTAGPNTVTFMTTPAEHPVGGWCLVQPIKKLVGGAVEANWWGIDEFGGNRLPVPGVYPNPADHIPVILTTLSVPILIQFKQRTSEVYPVDTVTSRRDYFSTGRMDIEKKGSGVGSGPHSKGYADGDSMW